MKQILVLYATREGHTRRIAEHVAADLRLRGLTPCVHDARASSPFDASAYDGAILLASAHVGRHEREMIGFVKEHRHALEKLPTAFISVSLAEAGAEMEGASPEKRELSEKEVRELINRFLEETGFLPTHVKPVAGALLYTKYNVLIRLVMKHIAKRSGGSTDTSRDHEYTDWEALDRFVSEFAASLE
jgi:menaquinone-dependent protoporphyrinogen oxidase